jgi:hypothetical protein
MDNPYDGILRLLKETLEKVRLEKPTDRSEVSRAFAVTITELEKAIAYFTVYVVQAANDTCCGDDCKCGCTP